jgi:hypothetical protein
MMLDALTTFLMPQAPPVSAVGAAGAVIQIGNVIDLLGVGPGNAPPVIIGNATLFGNSGMGLGVWDPEVQINIGTAFTTATSATANFAFQYAPDTATTYQPGTWETAAELGAKPASELTANQVFRMKVPPVPPTVLDPPPRYARIVMTVAPSGTGIFTAGTVTSAFIVQGRDDLDHKYAANNFVVA